MSIEVEIKKKQYKCEHCGKIHPNYSYFLKCPVCGKEVCTSCGVRVRLYRIDWQDFDDESYLAHKDCVDPCYYDWEYSYLAEFKRLENELYDKIAELNKEYLKGNDNLMRELANKNKASW